MIVDGEVARCPPTAPTLDLSSGQADHSGRFVGSQEGLLMKEQRQPKALDGLDRDGSARHGGAGLLQEIVREGTESGLRSWHGGIRVFAGISWGATSFYQESAETTTLFLKRTTKSRKGVLVGEEPAADLQHFGERLGRRVLPLGKEVIREEVVAHRGVGVVVGQKPAADLQRLLEERLGRRVLPLGHGG